MVQPPRAPESKEKEKKRKEREKKRFCAVNKFKVLEANQRKINKRLQFC